MSTRTLRDPHSSPTDLRPARPRGWRGEVVLLGTLLLSACGSDNGRPETETGLDSDQHAVLEGELLFRSPVLGQPILILVDGPSIWIVDAAGNPGIHEVDALSGEHLQSLGRRGAGPGELRGTATALLSDPRRPGGIWVWDLMLQRMTWFPSRIAAPPAAGKEPTMVPFSVTPRPLRMAVLSNGRLVAQTASAGERFVFLSFEGDRLGAMPGPVLEHPDVPLDRRISDTNSSVTLCPGPHGGFSVAYMFAGRIEVYNDAGELEALAQVPDPFPLYSTRPDGVLAVGDRVGYLTCASDGELIYAVYSGREIPPDRPTEDGDLLGTELHVFDRSGELVGIRVLKPGVSTISFGTDGSLYGGSLASGSIYRWKSFR